MALIVIIIQIIVCIVSDVGFHVSLWAILMQKLLKQVLVYLFFFQNK